MKAWRVILTLALMIGLLPWGAYSGARVLGAAAASVSASLDGSGAAASLSDATGRTATLQAPIRRCQRTALPGGPCAPDLMAPRGRAEVPAPRPVSAAWRMAQLPRLTDWTPPGALDPPRIG